VPSVSLIAIGSASSSAGHHDRDRVLLPGPRLETYEAINNNDLPMMQALFMFSSIAVIVLQHLRRRRAGLPRPAHQVSV
jgi:hypothetical protein